MEKHSVNVSNQKKRALLTIAQTLESEKHNEEIILMQQKKLGHRLSQLREKLKSTKSELSHNLQIIKLQDLKDRLLETNRIKSSALLQIINSKEKIEKACNLISELLLQFYASDAKSENYVIVTLEKGSSRKRGIVAKRIHSILKATQILLGYNSEEQSADNAKINAIYQDLLQTIDRISRSEIVQKMIEKHMNSNRLTIECVSASLDRDFKDFKNRHKSHFSSIFSSFDKSARTLRYNGNILFKLKRKGAPVNPCLKSSNIDKFENCRIKESNICELRKNRIRSGLISDRKHNSIKVTICDGYTSMRPTRTNNSPQSKSNNMTSPRENKVKGIIDYSRAHQRRLTSSMKANSIRKLVGRSKKVETKTPLRSSRSDYSLPLFIKEQSPNKSASYNQKNAQVNVDICESTELKVQDTKKPSLSSTDIKKGLPLVQEYESPRIETFFRKKNKGKMRTKKTEIFAMQSIQDIYYPTDLYIGKLTYTESEALEDEEPHFNTLLDEEKDTSDIVPLNIREFIEIGLIGNQIEVIR